MTKLTKLILGSGMLLLPLCLMAKTQVNKTLDADPNSIVEIEHTAGKARIEGWDKNQVKVEGTLGDDTEEFKFERNGKTIQIIVETETGGWGNWGGSNVDEDNLRIFVPKMATINYQSVNADVDILDIAGGAEVEVINGEIKAKNIAGGLEMTTVNGDLKGDDISGDVEVEAVNGDIKFSHKNGEKVQVVAVNGDIEFASEAKDIKIETVNGDMEAILTNVNSMSLDTVNGNIDVYLSLLDGARVRAASVSGDMEFFFDKDVQAKFDIEAHAGGDITNKLTNQRAQEAEFGPRSWLEFSKGNPKASVKVSTVSGGITLNSKK
ncbi:DUF4097 family beta strand repeat-containing protein [Glaciecola sp. 1036]|uniref:DUF4097 family beta strand repeat-containing protein n=1 Tax=Alteromonadaceae TaxID=72275 RepID=UPI003D05C36F